MYVSLGTNYFVTQSIPISRFLEKGTVDRWIGEIIFSNFNGIHLCHHYHAHESFVNATS